MKEFRLGRSENGFDPTATEAIARVSRDEVNSSPKGSVNDVFEPPKIYPGRLRKQMKRFRYKQELAQRLVEK